MAQVFDLAILKPGFELARPFQNQGRFQNGQVNNLAVSKRPGFQIGREHIHLVKVLYGKMLTTAKKQPTFPHRVRGFEI